MERFFLTKEYTDGTSETAYMTQLEAFQACSKALTEAVIERKMKGSTALARAYWGVEWKPGDIQILEEHNLSK